MSISYQGTIVNHRDATSLKMEPLPKFPVDLDWAVPSWGWLPRLYCELIFELKKLKWESNEKIFARLLFPRG